MSCGQRLDSFRLPRRSSHVRLGQPRSNTNEQSKPVLGRLLNNGATHSLCLINLLSFMNGARTGLCWIARSRSTGAGQAHVGRPARQPEGASQRPNGKSKGQSKSAKLELNLHVSQAYFATCFQQ